MRKWHRWLSVIFGVVLLWIALTGVASQIVPLVLEARENPARLAAAVVPPAQAHEGESHSAASPAMAESARSTPAAGAIAKPEFVCPPDYTCRPKPKPGDARSIIGTLHHLHSGESFGPLGVVVSTLAGLALVFFSVSGLWLYVQMWRNRRARAQQPGWFWD
jgi:uncharacterized iron-regulated membrane protein